MYNLGYRVITSFGEEYYYADINYEYFKKYNKCLSQEFRTFIDIMTDELELPEVFAEDMYIPFDELSGIIPKAEIYLKNYSNSTHGEIIHNYHERDVLGFLFGAYFKFEGIEDFDTKEIDEDAIAAYKKVAHSASDTPIKEIINWYLPLLEQNNYKLTVDIEKKLYDKSSKVFKDNFNIDF